jgi:dCTP deaminase
MIEEFSEAVGSPRISYGLTSAGYDVRMGGGILFIRKCKLDTPLSPKGHNNHAYVPTPTEPHVGVVLPPRSYALVYSHEYFRIPRDIKASCTGKSTYARLGLFVNTTPS